MAENSDTKASRPERRINAFTVFTYTFLTVMAVVYIAPFVWMVLRSVMNPFEANSAAFLPSQVLIENYHTALFKVQFGRFFMNTVAQAVIALTLQTLFALLAAYAFARMKFPGRDLLFGLFLMTIFVPSTVLLVPNLVLVTNISRAFESLQPALCPIIDPVYGGISQGAEQFGTSLQQSGIPLITQFGEWLRTIDPVCSFKWMNSWPALVIPFLANTFSIFLLRQFFKQIPDELWDAARMDGASHLRFLFQIVVPISRAAVLTTILLSFVGIWSALEWPILVTTDDNWRPISVALQQFRSSDAPDATHLLMAGSVIALMPVLILYFIAQRYFTEGIATTGLKG